MKPYRLATITTSPARTCSATLRKPHGGRTTGASRTAIRSAAWRHWRWHGSRQWLLAATHQSRLDTKRKRPDHSVEPFPWYFSSPVGHDGPTPIGAHPQGCCAAPIEQDDNSASESLIQAEPGAPWRRGWDSNPRWGRRPHQIANLAPFDRSGNPVAREYGAGGPPSQRPYHCSTALEMVWVEQSRSRSTTVERPNRKGEVRLG